MSEKKEPYIDWLIPVHTVSEANCSEHWSKKSKRHRDQKKWIIIYFFNNNPEVFLPCLIKITRIAPRKLDYDNLCASQKFVVDAICDCLIPGLPAGRADGDPRIKIEYFQKKGKPKEYAVKIEIFSI